MKLTVATPTRVRITREVVHHIKAWRKHLGLSVEALGEIAGVSGSMISQLERGKTTYTQNTLEALAGAMNLQPWQLLACGPEENAELWRVVMITTERRHLTEAASPDRLSDLETMLLNNSDAAVKSWGSMQSPNRANSHDAV